MIESHPLAPLLEALKAAIDWLEGCGVRGAVVGGIAASIYGRPRATRDVDIVAIAEGMNWAELVRRGSEYDIWPRQADALDFARTTRVILMEHRPTTVEIDLSIAGIAFEIEMIESARLMNFAGVSIPVACPDDILIMKCLALRPRDIADIEAILAVQEDLNLARVRNVIAEFSQVLEQDDYVSEWDKIVKRTLAKRR